MEALDRALHLLREEIAPRAQEIDGDVTAMRWALGRFAEEGLMAMRRPTEYGGPEVSEEDFRIFQEEVARTSGALAFCQTQHQSAVGMIARSENQSLKERYLPYMHDGTRLVGIGFSQLRRPGPPMMRATKVDGGYLLEGSVPWVTGWSFYPEFLMGATLPSGEALFGVVPLTDQPGVKVAPPMRLAAMEAAMTVSVEFDGYHLPDEQVAFIRPAGWIQRNDMINIALQGHFAIGCAQAGLDILLANAKKRGATFLCDAHDALEAELGRLKEATRQAQQDTNEETTEERLAVRAWAIELASRCAHAAVTSSAGAANSIQHPAQRVYREALVFTVSAQTAPIMEATLKRLYRGSEPSASA
jgi:alkylation response protein AidB-like acyl-CoA dehydrogenase